MSNNVFVNMTIYHHIKQKIAVKQLKIKSIHKDIIRLKQELKKGLNVLGDIKGELK